VLQQAQAERPIVLAVWVRRAAQSQPVTLRTSFPASQGAQ